MKNTHTLLMIPFLLVACASPIERKPPVSLKKEPDRQLGGTFIPPQSEDISLPEQIKNYHVGRYVDPADLNTLHERHTIYRREQTGHWNLAAAKGTGASRSYYLTADKTQQDKQQRAYYEAAQEQARLAKEKLSGTEQRLKDLEKENSDLKEKLRPSRIYADLTKQNTNENNDH